MNLAILDQFSDLGGAQRCLLEMLEAIHRLDWHATVGLPGDGELFGRVASLGFRAERITCGPYGSGQKSWADAARFLTGTPVLARQIGRLLPDADLLYINGPRLLPAAALARPRVPVIYHAHRIVPPGAMRRLAGAALRRLNARVIAVCQSIADSWAPYVAADRVAVIYNGVEGPGRPLWKPHTGAPRVGCIGRIAAEKGQREFLAAARIILSEIPECRFAIHGAALFGDAAARQYEAQVRDAAVGMPVDFAGWTPDVYTALGGLDLLLAPSDEHEATTRVIPEALAAGVPTIAFPNGGVPEVITHGVDGFLASSVDEMARIAIQLLRHPDAEVSRRARQTWEDRFTLARYQNDIVEAVRGALRPVE